MPWYYVGEVISASQSVFLKGVNYNAPLIVFMNPRLRQGDCGLVYQLDIEKRL